MLKLKHLIKEGLKGKTFKFKSGIHSDYYKNKKLNDKEKLKLLNYGTGEGIHTGKIKNGWHEIKTKDGIILVYDDALVRGKYSEKNENIRILFTNSMDTIIYRGNWTENQLKKHLINKGFKLLGIYGKTVTKSQLKPADAIISPENVYFWTFVDDDGEIGYFGGNKNYGKAKSSQIVGGEVYRH